MENYNLVRQNDIGKILGQLLDGTGRSYIRHDAGTGNFIDKDGNIVIGNVNTRDWQRVAALPLILAPNTVYFVYDLNDQFRIVITDQLGMPDTLDAPTFANLATKENSFAPGTASQYLRGDKTFQELDKNAVGLGNVNNTSDANKPISIATQAALDEKTTLAEVQAAFSTLTSKSVYQGQFSGLQNGTNDTFTMPDSYVENTMKVYKNGLRLTPGGSYDYAETGTQNSVQFAVPPVSDDRLIFQYLIMP